MDCRRVKQLVIAPVVALFFLACFHLVSRTSEEEDLRGMRAPPRPANPCLEPAPSGHLAQTESGAADPGEDPQPLEKGAGEQRIASVTAVRAVRSRNEATLLVNLELFRSEAGQVREALRGIALSEEEHQRARILAVYLIVNIDGPELSEVAQEILVRWLESPTRALQTAAVESIPDTSECMSALVPGLRQLALGHPSRESMVAGDILYRWGQLDSEEVRACLLRGLSSLDERAVDRALESCFLPSLESAEVASVLAFLMADSRRTLARIGPSPIEDMQMVRRKHAVMVVASRLSERYRLSILNLVESASFLSQEDFLLASLSLSGPDSLTFVQCERLLRDREVGVRWAASRVILDAEHVTFAIKALVARLAAESNHSWAISRMVAPWVSRLPEKDYQRLRATEHSEYGRWRLELLRGHDDTQVERKR